MSRYRSALGATLSGIVNRASGRRRLPPLALEHRLDGQRWLVTGATSGLGLAVARQLAARGAQIVAPARRDAPDALAAIANAGDRPPVRASMDLARLASVRAAAQDLARREIRLDGVVLNAGMVASRSRLTEDGFDEMSQVNHPGHFLLVQEILRLGVLPCDRQPCARVVCVSSESHRSAPPLGPAPLAEPRTYGAAASVAEYGRTKLMVTTFAQALARRHAGELAVHAVCPGAVNTRIAREAPGWTQPILHTVFRLAFATPERAAEPVVYLACHPEYGTRTGAYLHLMQEKLPAESARDESAQDDLWEAALEATRARAGQPR